MRILHVIRSVNPKGGGPIEGVTQLSHYYDQHCECEFDCHSEVLSLDSPDDEFVKSSSLRVYALGPTSLGGYGYSAKLKPWLMAHAHQYDAIIINGIWQYHSFGAWRALKQLGKPYYIFTHGMLDPWFKKTIRSSILKSGCIGLGRNIVYCVTQKLCYLLAKKKKYWQHNPFHSIKLTALW